MLILHDMVSATTLLCATLLFIGNPCSPARTLDSLIQVVHDDMVGEHWHELRFQNANIGTLHEVRTQLPSGEYVLSRSLRFSLTRTRTTDVNERFVFTNEFPYELLQAEQETTVHDEGESKTSLRDFLVNPPTPASAPSLSYLATLAFHPRLTADQDHVRTRTINFAESRLISTPWQIDRSSHDDGVYSFTSMDGSTTHLVASSGIPLKTNMPGGISLSITDQATAQRWQQNEYPIDDGGISVPVDQTIKDHQRLIGLTLRLHTSEATNDSPSSFADHLDYIKIDRQNPPVANVTFRQQTTSLQRASSESAVTRVISAAALDREVTYESLRRLVDVLHERIAYEDISIPTTVEETLERRSGDCTEYADALDAIAKQVGWHSRVKTGLAYHPPSQSFRPHSWNEVAVEGRWISADASWGQVPADASHVPFPRANTLALLAQASSMRFEVVDQQYKVD